MGHLAVRRCIIPGSPALAPRQTWPHQLRRKGTGAATAAAVLIRSCMSIGMPMPPRTASVTRALGNTQIGRRPQHLCCHPRVVHLGSQELAISFFYIVFFCVKKLESKRYVRTLVRSTIVSVCAERNLTPLHRVQCNQCSVLLVFLAPIQCG